MVTGPDQAIFDRVGVTARVEPKTLVRSSCAVLTNVQAVYNDIVGTQGETVAAGIAFAPMGWR